MRQLPVFTALILISPLATALTVPANPKVASDIPQSVRWQKEFSDLERLKVATRLYLRQYDQELEQNNPEWSAEDSDANASLMALHQLVDEKERSLLDEVDQEAPGDRAFVEKFIETDPNVDAIQLDQFLQKNPDISQQIDAIRADLGLTPALVSYRHRRGGAHTQRGPFVPSPGPSGGINGDEFPRGTWALTLDDGPDQRYGPKMVALSQKYEVPLTFFWLAKNVKIFKKEVQWIGELGYPRENHSFTHPMLSFMSGGRLQHEITDAQNVETKAFGEAPRFFRCPFGSGASNGSATRRMIAKNNMIHVLWNVDSRDWADHNPNSVLRRVLMEVNSRRGGIILFHEIHATSVPAVQLVLATLKSRNYRWVSIPQIVDEMNASLLQMTGGAKQPAPAPIPVTKTSL